MRKLRKLTAVLTAILMLAGMTMTFAIADEPSITEYPDDEIPNTMAVSLRIEGVEGTIFYEPVIPIEGGSTVEELMLLANEMDESLDIVVTTADWGDTYISEIAGLGEFDYGGYSGWLFRVNGVEATAGMGMTILSGGGEVVFFYNDAYGETGMQYPYADLSRLYSCKVITILSEDVVYDEDWNMSTVLNPVVGATVTFDGIVYITDENGEILLDSIEQISGPRSLQIERYDEVSGIPTVLRMPPDFVLYIPEPDVTVNEPFADISVDAWYYDAVMFGANAGFFTSIDEELNIFAPMSITTIAQLVTILATVAEEAFSGDLDTLYQEAFAWALENGIINENGLVADFAITREMFINMFYLTASRIGTHDMEARADITGAVDFDDIDEVYREAVSWAVAVELIRGTSSDVLTINPNAEITRAEVCQMLYNFLV